MNAHSRISRHLLLAALALTVLASSAAAKSKDDVVTLNNGDRMTGEIKSLEHGELKFKSSYMAESVLLDWQRVARLESKDHYIVALTTGNVFTARIELDATANPASSFLLTVGVASFSVDRAAVLRIRPADQNFWTQLNGSIDYGFSYTSGNSQYQTQLTTALVYNGEGYTVTGDLSSVFSGQSEGETTRRNNLNAQYWKLFKRKWFYGGIVDLLSSDQQSLDLRTSAGGAVGRTFIQTDRSSLSAFGGVAVARERFSSDQPEPQPRKTSAEALFGMDFSTFRFRSLDISSRFLVWPSLTDPGRIRMGLNSNFRVELVKDLFWNLNLYENFDSRPPINAKRNDLGVTTSFGWKF
jgi:hypothetical protein